MLFKKYKEHEIHLLKNPRSREAAPKRCAHKTQLKFQQFSFAFNKPIKMVFKHA